MIFFVSVVGLSFRDSVSVRFSWKIVRGIACPVKSDAGVGGGGISMRLKEIINTSRFNSQKY